MQEGRNVPLNELDYQSQLANPEWGNAKTLELYNKLGRSIPFVTVLNSVGKIQLNTDGSPMVFPVDMNGFIITNDGQKVLDEKGEDVQVMIRESLWGLMSYLTRDLRLGNLDKNDYEFCTYYLDLAGDCLREGYNDTFMACISRVASKLELSQSKRGFFRRILNTLTQEIKQNELEPSKKNSVFSGSKR